MKPGLFLDTQDSIYLKCLAFHKYYVAYLVIGYSEIHSIVLEAVGWLVY